VKISWTDFAKLELQRIFEFHKENASLSVAQKLTSGIVKESKKLIKQPMIGQEENLLLHFEKGYRYLVYKNYKIVYLINGISNTIEIHDVFDARQNPLKIGREK